MALWLTVSAVLLLVPAPLLVLATARHIDASRSVPSGLGNLVTTLYAIVCLASLLSAIASLRSSQRTAGSILLAVLTIIVTIACAAAFLTFVEVLLNPSVG